MGDLCALQAFYCLFSLIINELQIDFSSCSVSADRDLFFGYEPKLGTAMRRGDWKLIVKGEDIQLYDLKADPKETTNITAQHPERTKSMQQAIERFKQTVVPGS